MPPSQPPKFFRLLLIEDDLARVQIFRSWLPSWAKLVWAQSAGVALGLIHRDPGHVYGGVLLDHDLDQRAITEEDLSLSGTEVTVALMKHFSTDIPILIHSVNPSKAPQVARRLEDKGFWVTRIPFYALTEQSFLTWLEEAHGIWKDLAGD